MDDAALERALFALPLEEPPADLRGRILAATVYRPALPFKMWEVWVIGTLMALAVWLMIAVLTAVPWFRSSQCEHAGAHAGGSDAIPAALA